MSFRQTCEYQYGGTTCGILHTETVWAISPHTKRTIDFWVCKIHKPTHLKHLKNQGFVIVKEN